MGDCKNGPCHGEPKRDHFESMKDVWEMFRVVLDERKRREIDPTLAMIQECLRETEMDSHTRGRLNDLREFFETTTGRYEQVRRWPASALARFAKMGDKALKFIGSAGKISFFNQKFL